MGHERQVGPSKDSHIPPNRKGLLFSSNPPLFDPQREGLTREDINRANAVIGSLGQEGRITTPVALSLGGLGLLGTGFLGGWLIRDVLASESIDSFDNSFNSGPQLQGAPHLEQLGKPNKDEVFDNEATSGVITPAMIERIPEEEMNKLNSFARLTGQKTKIVTLTQGAPAADRAASPDNSFPDYKFQIGEDKNTILLLHPLDFSLSSNPNVEIKLTKSYGGMRQADHDYLKGKGYYDTYEYRGKDGKSIPKGTIVKMPVVSENGGYLIMNTHGDGYLYFQANDGTKYRLDVDGVKGDNAIPFKPLVDAPVLTDKFKEILKDKGVTAGSQVTRSQPILQTTEDVDSISIYVTASKDGVLVPTNLELFVSSDNLLITSD